MEILKKPYKKSTKGRKFAGSKWPHERAQIALRQRNKKTKFEKDSYNKDRAERIKQWKEWF